METSTATISVLQVTAIHAGRVLALADVELILDGVSLVIHGVQVRADASKTEITLPNYRAPDGSWKTAVTLPDDVRGPMADVVIAAAMEIGILMEKAAIA
jgi:stage V sporulation protein G